MTARRFPPPWSVEETDACVIVRDANRQAFYFKDELDSRRCSAPDRNPQQLEIAERYRARPHRAQA
jgi:hypothetical protein